MSNAAPSGGEPTMEEILASIRRIISEEENETAKSAVDLPPAPPEEPEDVLELTNVVSDPEPVPQPPTPPRAAPPADDIAFESPAPAQARAAAEAGLVAEAVAARAASAFDQLHRETADPTYANGPTLEGFVAAIVKPMLKEWLDANLPALVETVVREEVERVASRRR